MTARHEVSARPAARRTARLKCLIFKQPHAPHGLKPRAYARDTQDTRVNACARLSRVNACTPVRSCGTCIHAGYRRAGTCAGRRAGVRHAGIARAHSVFPIGSGK